MNDYSLTVLHEIVDEGVPTSETIQSTSMFSVPFYIAMCVLILILVYVIHYICECIKYQRRVTKMTGKKQKLMSAREGKRTAYEAEVQKAEQLYNKIMFK